MKPRVDIGRIAYHAGKPLPAHIQNEIDQLAGAFQELQLARSIEALTKWAYDEGFKDGSSVKDNDAKS